MNVCGVKIPQTSLDNAADTFNFTNRNQSSAVKEKYICIGIRSVCTQYTFVPYTFAPHMFAQEVRSHPTRLRPI